MLRDDAIFAAAAAIPPKSNGSVGRARTFPDFVWALWPVLRGVFGSHRAVERELGRGGWWRYIRRELRRLRPDLPRLPERPPRRQDFEYIRDRYLATDEGVRRALETHTKLAAEQAVRAGNFAPSEGSLTHPAVTRTLYGDGKTITPLYRAKSGATRIDRKTGEVRNVRYDPDAGWHTEGGGESVYGVKFALLSTRRSEGRFILAIEHVTKQRDEARAALDMIRGTRPYAPDAQALVWDMILRGDHLQTIMTEFGLVPVVGVHAKRNPNRRKGRHSGTFVPKTLDLDVIRVPLPDGTMRAVTIAARNGWACVKELTETGAPYYEPLEPRAIKRPKDKRGYRFYRSYRLPEEYGRREILIRHHGNSDDEARGINRAENLRLIPEGSWDFARLHVLQSDAESINRGIEDSLFINRASGRGWRRQMVDLLGHAKLVNAVTLARCRASEQLRAAA